VAPAPRPTKHRETDATTAARGASGPCAGLTCGEGGGMRAVLDKEGFQALERTLAPGEPNAVDGEIVDETRVEMVLGVARSPPAPHTVRASGQP